jgi:hypothetical protein
MKALIHMATESHNPWASGPGEILRHGLDLLKRENDTNRRLAMISIDNAVEWRIVEVRHLLTLVVLLTGLLSPLPALAQAWDGKLSGVPMQIALRPEKGIPIFVVQIGTMKERKKLSCGLIDGATHQVLFCGDDLNNYNAGKKTPQVRVANQFNILFTYQTAQYFCEASTAQSVLMCSKRSQSTRSFSNVGHLDPAR